MPQGEAARTVLEELRYALGECLVSVQGAKGFQGTGFYVAPGLVLTCSHVLAEDPQSENWLENSSGATVQIVEVVERLPAGATPTGFPPPDLALLRVAAAARRCAFIAWPSPQPTERELVAVGVRADSNGAILDRSFQVPLRLLRKKFGAWELQTVDPALDIVGGMSGSPVLDTVTGAVVAIIKGNRSGEAKAIPLSSALDALDCQAVHDSDAPTPTWGEHDRHHAADGYWAERLSRMPGAELRPSVLELAELFGIIASMRVQPGLPARIVNEIAGQLPVQPEAPLRSAADGIRALVQSPPRGGAEDAILRYLEMLCHENETSGSCQDWASDYARRSGKIFETRLPAVPPVGGIRPGILVVVRPLDDRERKFMVNMWLVKRDGSYEHVFADSRHLTAVSVKKDPEVRAALHRSLNRLRENVRGTDEFLVEFVVPAALRDIEPGAWPIYRGDHNLGERHVVVVRDFYRFDSDAEDRELQRAWWSRISAQFQTPLGQVSCENLRTSAELGDMFEQNAIVMAGPAGRDTRGHRAFEEFVFRGGAVAVWPLSPCPDHQRRAPQPPGACRGDTSAGNLTTTLQGVKLEDFALRLWRELRSPVGKTGLAIFYDDPSRRPPDRQYRSPARSGK